jgi:hypothetical protein
VAKLPVLSGATVQLREVVEPDANALLELLADPEVNRAYFSASTVRRGVSRFC